MELGSFARRVGASAFFVGALALGVVANGCGREPSMASRSATAYQKAVELGLPVGSGHGGHGGSENADHSGTTVPEATAEHGHGTGGGANGHSAEGSSGHAGADPGLMKGMDQDRSELASAPAPAMVHSRHAGGSSISGMDHSHTTKPSSGSPAAGVHHSQPAGGSPVPISGMDHSKPVAETNSPMAVMDHSAMGHGTPAAIPEPARTPTSSSEIGRLDPVKTLASDEFDRVVATPTTGGAAEKP
jgi:hypothetical protein